MTDARVRCLYFTIPIARVNRFIRVMALDDKEAIFVEMRDIDDADEHVNLEQDDDEAELVAPILACKRILHRRRSILPSDDDLCSLDGNDNIGGKVMLFRGGLLDWLRKRAFFILVMTLSLISTWLIILVFDINDGIRLYGILIWVRLHVAPAAT
jgi:hypothetical protein